MSDPNDSLNALVEVLTPAQRDMWVAKTATEFNAAFSELLLEAVRRLEKGSKNLNNLNEDGLSEVLCGFVNGTKILTVTREESSNGHVDLTFKANLCRPTREVLGEAKIFNYYEWHVKGLSQLVESYSTGRENRSLLLEYVKAPGIKGHMEKLRSELDEKMPCDQIAPCREHETVKQWSFCSSHTHLSGEVVEVWHFGCNLHQTPAAPKPTKKKSGTKRSAS